MRFENEKNKKSFFSVLCHGHDVCCYFNTNEYILTWHVK